MSRARDRADGVLHNRTHEDTEGGRESIVTFKGEQSGGEISTLAQIQASHDGTSDDEKADLIFKTNDGSDGASPTTAMVIDSGQNILIGKTDAETTISGGTPAFQLTGAGFDSALGITRREANQYGASLFLSKSRNTTANSHTIVQNNDVLGSINFVGDDGTNLDTYGASISAEVNGTPSANDLPTRLKFSVTHDGASTPTEKLRIDEHGLKFNGDTAEANALHDYEEGTWTPTSPTVTLTGGPGGHYTKIGRMVIYTATFQFPSSSSTVQAIIDGLPFSDNGTGAGSFLRYTNYGGYIFATVSSNRIFFYDLNGSALQIASVDPSRFDLIGVLMTA
tara:strand:- start:1586 stop:2596 length:1011 start_codon:yes stop_codon:yes gene_type:complete